MKLEGAPSILPMRNVDPAGTIQGGQASIALYRILLYAGKKVATCALRAALSQSKAGPL